jgi:hypothetical protein
MGVVKNIMVRAVADFSGLISGSKQAGDAIREMSNRMNSSTRGLTGSLGSIATKLAALAGIYVGLDFLKDATSDAIQFEARMQTLNDRMGDSSGAFQKWADTTGKAMGYSKLQIAEYGNTYSNMLYDTAKSQADLEQRTTKLLEVSAIIRSKLGMKQEEVSQRIRSALNQEADGADELGINVRATAVEHSNAFKIMAAGVKNFSDLSSGMQKAILYQYILDEATRKYGTTLADNVATKTSVFVASLADLKLHLGQAFLPIWSTVLPSLTSLINWLDMAAQKVAVFFRVLFGYSAQDPATKKTKDTTQAFKAQTTAVKDLTDAHKKLQSSVAGFDEVNTLSQPSDAGKPKVPGASTPKDTASPKDDPGKGGDTSVFSKIVEFAKQVRQGFKDIKEGWDSFWQAISAHKDIIISALVAVAAVLAVLYGPGMIAGIVTFGISFVASMIPVIASAWSAAAAFLAVEWPILLVIAAVAALAFGLTMMVLHWKEVQEWGSKVWASIVEVWDGAVLWFATKVIAPFMEGWNNAWGDLKKGVGNAWTNLSGQFVGAATWFWDNVCKPIIDFFVDFATDVGTGAVKVWNAISGAFKTATTWFWDNVCKPIIDKFVDFATKAGEGAVKVWGAIKGAFSTAASWFKENVVDTVVKKFDDWKSDIGTKATDAWTAIKDAFKEVASWFDKNVVTPVQTAFSKISDGLGKGIETAFKAVYNTVAGYINDVFKTWNAIVGSNPLTKGLKIDYELPKLAKGGITNGPMAALIGDNPGGQEVVSPLSDLQGHIATAVIQALAFSQPQRNTAPQGDIVLNIDGRQFARIVKPYMDNANKNTTVMLNRI